MVRSEEVEGGAAHVYAKPAVGSNEDLHGTSAPGVSKTGLTFSCLQVCRRFSADLFVGGLPQQLIFFCQCWACVASALEPLSSSAEQKRIQRARSTCEHPDSRTGKQLFFVAYRHVVR